MPPDRATGSIEWVGRNGRGCWFARISIPGEGRQRIKLKHPRGHRFLTDRDGDRELARKLATQLSEHLRADATNREAARLAGRLSVQQLGEMWTSGELLKRYGPIWGLREKKSVSDDKYRLQAHVYPHIGHVAVADVTGNDIGQMMARAAAAAEEKRGKPWRQATRWQLYQLVKRLFDLAVEPAQLRADNPVSAGLRPPRDAPKLYSFLYPAELVALLGCEAVPLPRRVHYALAIYTGLRKGSLGALTWGSVDFEHGTLTSLESKTGLPQIFALSDPALPGLQSLQAVLARYRVLQGRPGRQEPIVGDLGCRAGREAEALRADLQAAGVRRELLFTRSAKVEPLRFHDARATFVSWARRAGKGRGWIADRTGHLTDAMMDRYDRGARLLADLRYEPFPDISDAIPELSRSLPNSAE